MTVDDVARWIAATRRRQMREFLASVRFGRCTDRLVERGRGYDPQAYRQWLEQAGKELV